MQICPKCGAYYVAGSSAFCLADGTPLVSVSPNSDSWAEGTRALTEKAEAFRKLQRSLKWRRVLKLATTTLVTITVVCVVAVNGLLKFNLLPIGSNPTPVPATTAAVSPSPTFASTPVGTHVFKISGRVMADAKPLRGITVRIDGPRLAAQQAMATTDTNGNYSFNLLLEGSSYTITPVAEGITFTPESRLINSLSRDESADFATVTHTESYKISGRVTVVTLAGKQKDFGPVSIKLTSTNLDGTKTTATTRTDPNGSYSFGGLPAGSSHTITPEKRPGVDVTPGNRTITNLRLDESKADFELFQRDQPPAKFRISGRVTNRGRPLEGVNIVLRTPNEQLSEKTDANGFYSFNDLPAGDRYAVAPSSPGVRFLPLSRLVYSLTGDEPANFEVFGQPDESPPNGPTKTSTPVGECTDDDRQSVLSMIRAKFPRVELIHSKVETCTATLIIVSCEWGARNERVPDKFKCEKPGREWQCH